LRQQVLEVLDGVVVVVRVVVVVVILPRHLPLEQGLIPQLVKASLMAVVTGAVLQIKP
jgi:hypothetical protein